MGVNNNRSCFSLYSTGVNFNCLAVGLDGNRHGCRRQCIGHHEQRKLRDPRVEVRLGSMLVACGTRSLVLRVLGLVSTKTKGKPTYIYIYIHTYILSYCSGSPKNKNALKPILGLITQGWRDVSLSEVRYSAYKSARQLKSALDGRALVEHA